MELFIPALCIRGSTLLQMLLCLLCCFILYIAFRAILSRHWQSLYEELTIWFSSGVAAVLRPKVLWSTPLPVQKSTIETTSMESPSMPKFVSDRPMMVQVECLHIVLFPKVLYRPTIWCRQVCRPSYILKVPGEVLFHCSVKFWCLQEIGFLSCMYFWKDSWSMYH